MSRGQWTQGSGGGLDTSEVTATADKVLKGYTAGVKDHDEPQEGTLEVQSIVNFKVALYGSYALAGTWQNPEVGPYSGVMIRYAAGQYPESVSDGTLAYEGAANNFTVSGLVTGTRYYFRAWSYITTNYGRIYSDDCQESEETSQIVQGSLTFTSSTAWTVPTGVGVIQVFCVGGGGGGGIAYTDHSGDSSTSYTSGASGGGYTNTYTVTTIPGEVLAINIGGGGGQYGGNGGRSSLTRNGSLLAYADGGGHARGASSPAHAGGSGGSGGAACGKNGYSNSGGSNGGNGSDCWYRNNRYLPGGQGQGRTTRAFGASNGTLYAGGGGATRGSGGAGGGGSNGGAGGWATGGGGAVTSSWEGGPGGAGGSGVILIRWGY